MDLKLGGPKCSPAPGSVRGLEKAHAFKSPIQGGTCEEMGVVYAR